MSAGSPTLDKTLNAKSLSHSISVYLMYVRPYSNLSLLYVLVESLFSDSAATYSIAMNQR